MSTICNKKDECLQPEKGKGDPRKCSAEQIKECHGDTECHPCECPMHKTSEGPDEASSGTASEGGETQ